MAAEPTEVVFESFSFEANGAAVQKRTRLVFPVSVEVVTEVKVNGEWVEEEEANAN